MNWDDSRNRREKEGDKFATCIVTFYPVTISRLRYLKHIFWQVVIVGDGNSGKTSLLWRIKNPDEEELPQFDPTVYELGAYRLGNTFIEFVDTAGQEDFASVRIQCYHGADLFIVLCTADRMDTLQNVK